MQKAPNLNPYWLLLKDLSLEEKLSLIELLVKSIQGRTAMPESKQTVSPEKDDDIWVHQFAGSWSDLPGTAEEMIALVEGARTASLPTKSL